MKVEDLKNTKIYLSNEEDRIKFQKKVFKLGIEWFGCSTNISFVRSKYYYIGSDLKISYNYSTEYFINKRIKQIFLDEVLSIEEPKIDFKPFDKVLVRDGDNGVWVPRFYSNRRRESISYPFAVTSGGAYKQCIPYEGNEQFVETTKSKDE